MKRTALFGHGLAAAVLLATASLPVTGHAAIDVGNTIVSVSTASSSHSDPGGTIYSSTSAVFNQHSGVTDASTGLQWIKASSLQEGQAQGYRLATAAEFRTWLQDQGWTPGGAQPDQWTLGNGFSYTTSSSSSSVAGYSSYSTNTTNLAAVSFKADVVGAPSTTTDYNLMASVTTTLSASLALLDNGQGGLTAGGWFDQVAQLERCYNSNRSSGCTTTINYAHDAVVANAQDLKSGLYDAASHATGGNWSGLLAGLPSTGLQYYMVAAVPEPATYLLMGLGLAGVLLGARRRRQL